ncbi:hypothetical protein NDU88_004346 [Pleurodeles waltl]|uniref:Uncharacterized protein n=1 Tax=Pleurodeles waltl TaxID=8319 RepID=A0AAV7UGU8_PLEWA|nr:hypothetical protein NDU88_004346 [Pleurodeles waltl]
MGSNGDLGPSTPLEPSDPSLLSVMQHHTGTPQTKYSHLKWPIPEALQAPGLAGLPRLSSGSSLACRSQCQGPAPSRSTLGPQRHRNVSSATDPGSSKPVPDSRLCCSTGPPRSSEHARPNAPGHVRRVQRETSLFRLHRTLRLTAPFQVASPGCNKLDLTRQQRAHTPGPGCSPQLGREHQQRAHGPLPSAGSPTKPQSTRRGGSSD